MTWVTTTRLMLEPSAATTANHQVVRERALGGDALESHRDRVGLGWTDPDRQISVPFRLLEDDDVLAREHVDAHALHDHLDQPYPAERTFSHGSILAPATPERGGRIPFGREDIRGGRPVGDRGHDGARERRREGPADRPARRRQPLAHEGAIGSLEGEDPARWRRRTRTGPRGRRPWRRRGAGSRAPAGPRRLGGRSSEYSACARRRAEVDAGDGVGVEEPGADVDAQVAGVAPGRRSGSSVR